MSDQAEFWDERYKGEGFAFGKEPNAFLVNQAHRLKPGLRALAPGDGEGRNGVWLSERGLIVDTVDVSPLGVAKARELARSRGVDIKAEVADLLTWEWPRETYDIVAALYIHFFDDDRPRMHRAMLEALKPGGILILGSLPPGTAGTARRSTAPAGRRPWTCSTPRPSSPVTSPALPFLSLRKTTVELAEGARHRGLAAVIRAVVQKPE